MRSMLMVMVLVGCGPVDAGWDGGGYYDEDDAAGRDAPAAPVPDCAGVLEGAYAICPDGWTPGCFGDHWSAPEGPPGSWQCYLPRHATCHGGTAGCGVDRAACIADRRVTVRDGTWLECGAH